LHSLFQPIICLSERRILGYEALSRGPSNSPLHSPIALFAVPARPGASANWKSPAASACRRFSEQQLPGKLFLNVSPESLIEAAPNRAYPATAARLRHPAEPSGDRTHRTDAIDDFDLLQTALHHYRAMGFPLRWMTWVPAIRACCGRNCVRIT
jgi:EAL domain-containing protein (putative c-di-GMP-specific phosphodiesterase class I)